jgi:hypothetical protein
VSASSLTTAAHPNQEFSPELLAAFMALKPAARKKGAARKPPSSDEAPREPATLAEPLKKTG